MSRQGTGLRIKTSGYGIKRAGRRIAERVDSAFARSLRLMGSHGPRRTVVVAGVYRDAQPILSVVEELRRSRHRVVIRLGAMGDAAAELADETVSTHLTAGKFQNLNELVGDLSEADWLLIVDDDVRVPPRFLDTAVELCERLDFALAQPAQTRFSNANWTLTKRRLLTVARQTQFVEIGPVTLIRADALAALVPFPAELRWGWGLDFHWAYLMTAAGLRMGVIDALAVDHGSRKVASTYSWDAAQAEGTEWLRGVPNMPREVAGGRGLVRYRIPPRIRRR